MVNFVAGRDVFISLPWEVSWLPSIFNLLRNSKSSIVIVVCLLKSLMEDQVSSPRPQALSLGTRPTRQLIIMHMISRVTIMSLNQEFAFVLPDPLPSTAEGEWSGDETIAFQAICTKVRLY